MSRGFVFPGQGSQAVGMGCSLAEAFSAAREVFEEVDDALNQSLSRIMFEGPEADLTLTENAQPALLAHSYAVLQILRKEGGLEMPDMAAFVAGHSLGEYSALAAAGTFTLADAVRLVKRRGQAMQQAVPVGEGAMAALLGLDLEVAREVAEEAAQGEVCAPANDNAPGQVVISGATAAVERAAEIAKEKGARRAVLLPVSAPFHCSMMAPAAEEMAAALEEVELAPPSVPVVANVTASTVADPATIRKLLVEQVTGMVRWRESVEHLKQQGVAHVVELGPGKVLSGLVRRIDREIETGNAGEPDEVEALLKSLS